MLRRFIAWLRSPALIAICAASAVAAHADPPQPPLPDLVVEELRLPEQLPAGEPVEVIVFVRNVGAAEAGGPVASLSADGQLVASKRGNDVLRPGEREGIPVRWVPEGEATVTLTARVDPERRIAEADEENNQASAQAQVGAPRSAGLRVLGLKLAGDPRVGSPVEARITLSNQGELPVYRFPVKLLVDGRETAAVVRHGELASGTSAELALNWIPSRPGAQELTAVLGEAAPSAENSASARVEVVGPVLARSDRSEGAPTGNPLRPVEFKLEGEARQGSPVETRITISNQSEALVYRFPVRILVDGKKSVDVVRHHALEPGKSTVMALKWIPPQAGPAEVTVVVGEGDPGPANSLRTRVEVAPRATHDIKVEAFEVPAEPVAGRQYELVVRLVNEGDIGAFSARAQLVIDGQTIATGRTSESVEPGGSVPILLAWTPMRPGKVSLSVVVESRGPLPESDLEDNRAEVERVVIASKSRRNP
ncbi:MAG: hypothetical protein HY319_07765 [Armatimonadetes bacterium]|nr:hypothetical protein [Armatimonadota bacterium]